MKTCRVCGAEKPLSEYSPSKGNRDGHVTICKPCSNEKSKAYRLAHPEQWKTWASQNRERLNQWRATYRRGVAPGQTLPRRTLSLRKQRATHPQEWREKRRSQKHEREARLRQVPRERVLLSVLIERDGRCQVCFKPKGDDEWTIDHILPVSHTYVNTRLAHRKCNERRGNRGAAQLQLMSHLPGGGPETVGGWRL